MNQGTLRRTIGIAALSAALLAGCGGGATPSSPSPGTPGTGSTGGGGSAGGGTGTTGGTTVTITPAGVSPKELTVPAGSRVTFVNSDTRVHDMASDPHPDHTDCPEINSVGFLQPGQSRQTDNLVTPRTCGYHDHNRDTDESLKGRIIIQ